MVLFVIVLSMLICGIVAASIYILVNYFEFCSNVMNKVRIKITFKQLKDWYSSHLKELRYNEDYNRIENSNSAWNYPETRMDKEYCKVNGKICTFGIIDYVKYLYFLHTTQIMVNSSKVVDMTKSNPFEK